MFLQHHFPSTFLSSHLREDLSNGGQRPTTENLAPKVVKPAIQPHYEIKDPLVLHFLLEAHTVTCALPLLFIVEIEILPKTQHLGVVFSDFLISLLHLPKPCLEFKDLGSILGIEICFSYCIQHILCRWEEHISFSNGWLHGVNQA